MSAAEMPADDVKPRNAPATRGAVRSRAEEIGPNTTELAGHIDYADDLVDFMPVTLPDSHPIN
jgi:hypothetical protein